MRPGQRRAARRLPVMAGWWLWPTQQSIFVRRRAPVYQVRRKPYSAVGALSAHVCGQPTSSLSGIGDRMTWRTRIRRDRLTPRRTGLAWTQFLTAPAGGILAAGFSAVTAWGGCFGLDVTGLLADTCAATACATIMAARQGRKTLPAGCRRSPYPPGAPDSPWPDPSLLAR